MNPIRYIPVLFLAALVPCFASSADCSGSASDRPAGSDARERLLDIAFLSASRIPAEPHIKGRSKIQEAVVQACLELEMTERAEYFAERIENWRRGSCFAELAFAHARAGDQEAARRCLAEARDEADRAEDWRRDRIRVGIARALVALGETDQAGAYDSELEAAERGKSIDARLMNPGAASAEAVTAELDALLSDESFDVRKNALEACARYYSSLLNDSEARNALEAKIRNAWTSMPVTIRLDHLKTLCSGAIATEDIVKAEALIQEAVQLINAHQWPLEHELPLRAEFATLRFKAGGRDEAAESLNAAAGLYEARKGEIYDIWRADALRPVASGFASIGDPARAAELYAAALGAGFENPNGFPRAEDLAETCVSMARSGFTPDSELLSRIFDLHAKLDAPW